MKKYLSSIQIRELKQLIAEGFSLNYVSDKFSLRKSTVYYHTKDCCRKMSKLNLDLLDDCEKGYIIGLFLGDGSFNRGQKEPRFFVRFTLDKKRDNDIALRLLQIFEKAEKRLSIFYWRSNIIAKVCSKELVEYIQKFVTYRKCFKEKSQKIFFYDKN